MRSFLKCAISSFLILSTCYDETMAAGSLCGDWKPYKDEKCIKIIDETRRTFHDAVKTCSQQENSATLVTIHTKDEQEFLSNLLFKTHQILDNVWIGAKYTSNKFKWIDDSDLSFTNWVKESPKNKTNRNCVKILPEDSSMGKWVDERCNKKNLVVCQKMQTWSLFRLQNILMDVRRELKGSQQQLNNLQQNPFPIGFIYVQLPGQPDPRVLWPTMVWGDISSEFAGLFFRVEGGGSAAFGLTQEENSPRLLNVKRYGQWEDNGEITLEPGQWTKPFLTGIHNGAPISLSFYVSPGEVRPRNKAMRVWKRTN